MTGDTVDHRVHISYKEEKKPKPVKGTLQPSPAKKIRFADGEVMELNRKERRRLKIYNKDLKRG